MKRSLKKLATAVGEKLSQENTGHLAKTIWLELQKSRSLGQIDQLAQLIRYEIAIRENAKIAEIFSAEKLSTDQERLIVERLEKRFNQKIIPVFHLDTNIIGGIKIKIDDELIDLSLVGKLQSIRARLGAEN